MLKSEEEKFFTNHPFLEQKQNNPFQIAETSAIWNRLMYME